MLWIVRWWRRTYAGAMAKKAKRFEVAYQQGTMSQYRIIRDTQTGVCYLILSEGYTSGITPLLNADGSIVVQWENFDSPSAEDDLR